MSTLQVGAVSTTVTGYVDITAAIHLQPAVFTHGTASPTTPAAPEPGQEKEQPQPSVPTAAQQHSISIQVLIDHLLESQQARWQDGSFVVGSNDGGSRPESPRGRAAFAGLRDAVFDIIAPRDWTAQLPDPPGACVCRRCIEKNPAAFLVGRCTCLARFPRPQPRFAAQHQTLSAGA